jgi:hypothetical protein
VLLVSLGGQDNDKLRGSDYLTDIIVSTLQDRLDSNAECGECQLEACDFLHVHSSDAIATPLPLI